MITRVNEFYDRGAEKTCPICGVEFYVTAPNDWVYKADVRGKGGVRELVYFNKYSCFREHQRRQEEKEKKRQEEKIQKTITTRKNNRSTPASPTDYEDKQCISCRYCLRGKFGFTDCTIRSVAINPYRAACARFKPRVAKPKQPRRNRRSM